MTPEEQAKRAAFTGDDARVFYCQFLSAERELVSAVKDRDRWRAESEMCREDIVVHDKMLRKANAEIKRMKKVTTELAKTTTDLISFDAAKVALIKRMVAKDATDDELELFLHQCRRTGLDPMAKQIYFQKRAGKPVIITGIDGYRLVADRTGKYAGNDDPVFDNEESPCRATVSVYKMLGGLRCPFTATARWHQYYPGEKAGAQWDKMPHLMLGKCAEALALRKAFPAELSGMHTDVEMEQAAQSMTGAQQAAEAAFRAGNPGRQEEGYDPQKRQHQDWLIKQLKAKNVPDDRWDDVGNALRGRPASDLAAVMASIFGG